MIEINNIVFSGGSIKGIAFCGALEYLNDCPIFDFKVKEVCGVSVGSIFGLMYVLGYTPIEIKKKILDYDFNTLTDRKILKFNEKFGIDTGNGIMKWIKKDTSDVINSDCTLLELYNKTGILFKILATNLSRNVLEIFDYTTHPDLNIYLAIRMSIGIPLYFNYTEYNGNIYADGGIINKFPINLYKDSLDNTLAFRLERMSSMPLSMSSSMSLDEYIENIVKCIRQKNTDNTEIINHKYTINLTININPLKFNLTRTEKQEILALGYSQTELFFKNSVNTDI